MENDFKYSLIVLGVIIILLLLSKLPGHSIHRGERVELTQLQALGDEAKRMFVMARQDQNPLLALLHSTRAMSKVHTLRLLGPPHRLAKKLDLDLNALKSEISLFQTQKINEINATCPLLSLTDSDSVDSDWFV